MLGLPNDVVGLFERFTLVLVIIFVGIDTLRTLRLVEAKIALRAKKKSGGEERQIRAAETQYSVMHRMLNVLVVLATIGAALTVFDQVRAFGASLLTSAGIVGLVAGGRRSANTAKRLRRSAACHHSADCSRRCG